jgi:pheromone shutdown protein TraB
MIVERLSDRLILIGTAHVFPESVKTVREVILAEKPEIVGVELCPQRYAALKSGSAPPSHPIALILYLIQEFFSKRTGVQAGREMLEAAEAAEEIGARLEFLDRDINVTLQRLLRLGIGEKLKFLAWLVAGLFLSPRLEPSELRGDVISRLLHEFRRMCPGFYRVLVQERDEYMVTRILELSARGKMVCVVGAGHLQGLARALGGWSFKVEWQIPFNPSLDW